MRTPFDKSVVKGVRLLSEAKNVSLTKKANETITGKARVFNERRLPKQLLRQR